MKQLMNLNNLIVFLPIFFFSCMTTEQLEADKLDRESKAQMQEQKEQQKNELFSSLISRTQALEERLNSMSGSVEEISYKSQQSSKESNDQVLKLLDEQSKRLGALESEMLEQRKFIEKVTETLKKISTNLK